MKILPLAHPAKIAGSSTWTLAFLVLLTTGGRRVNGTRSAEVEELLVGQKFTKYLDFEAYLGKFEASTYTKVTKDDSNHRNY